MHHNRYPLTLVFCVTLLLAACASTNSQQHSESAEDVESAAAKLPTHPAPDNADNDDSGERADASRPAQPLQTNSWQLQGGEVVIHVGKAGRLARLGHNHLVAGSDLEGSVWLDGSGALQAELSLAVATLTVDDPERRASYVARDPSWEAVYRSTPSSKNIADTTANMLGSKVLAADTFPSLFISASAPGAAAEFEVSTAGSLNIELGIQVRDHQTQLPAILHWSRQPTGRVIWHSRFAISHAALGLVPFSALGGALSVAETLNIEVHGSLEAEIPIGNPMKEGRSGSVQPGIPSVRTDAIE